jgi:acyl-CoA thioesterase FadM
MNLLLRLFLLLISTKRRSHVPVLGPCVTPFRVWINDLDVLRHMNNGRYFSILDLARVDLMARSGLWDKLKVLGWYPVVVDERMIFRRSLKLFDRYDVRTTVVGWDDKHILMEQVFVRGDAEVAIGFIKARLLKKTGGSVTTEELLQLAEITQSSPLGVEQVKAWPAVTPS